jgi:hypothetical protein
MSISRRLSALLAGAALLGAALGPVCLGPRGAAAQERGWTGNANFTPGFKFLDEDDWDPVDLQGSFGGEVDARPRPWPVNLAVGLRLSSGADEVGVLDVEGATVELTVGLKKVFEPSGNPIRPFVGGGAALVAAAVTQETASGDLDDDDAGVGFYLSGGIFWTINEHFNVGFEARYTDAEVTLFGRDVEAGGVHVGGLVGYHW